jgi:hypothetical protein
VGRIDGIKRKNDFVPVNGVRSRRPSRQRRSHPAARVSNAAIVVGSAPAKSLMTEALMRRWQTSAQPLHQSNRGTLLMCLTNIQVVE